MPSPPYNYGAVQMDTLHQQQRAMPDIAALTASINAALRSDSALRIEGWSPGFTKNLKTMSDNATALLGGRLPYSDVLDIVSNRQNLGAAMGTPGTSLRDRIEALAGSLERSPQAASAGLPDSDFLFRSAPHAQTDAHEAESWNVPKPTEVPEAIDWKSTGPASPSASSPPAPANAYAGADRRKRPSQSALVPLSDYQRSAFSPPPNPAPTKPFQLSDFQLSAFSPPPSPSPSGPFQLSDFQLSASSSQPVSSPFQLSDFQLSAFSPPPLPWSRALERHAQSLLTGTSTYSRKQPAGPPEQQESAPPKNPYLELVPGADSNWKT